MTVDILDTANVVNLRLKCDLNSGGFCVMIV